MQGSKRSPRGMPKAPVTGCGACSAAGFVSDAATSCAVPSVSPLAAGASSSGSASSSATAWSSVAAPADGTAAGTPTCGSAACPTAWTDASGLTVSSAADGAGATPEAAIINDAIRMVTSSLFIACLDAVMPMRALNPDAAAQTARAPRTAAPPITGRETAPAGDWARSWRGHALLILNQLNLPEEPSVAQPRRHG